jgi:metallo-beta-lactamase class B
MSRCWRRFAGQPRAHRRRGPVYHRVPDRATWHAEPVRVFDNLYYVGEKEDSAWAVVTSDGIIIIECAYGARIVMSAADWDFTEKSRGLLPAIKPKRDVVVADGDKLMLGDTTLSIYQTPGTISLLVPVKDGGRPHLVAAWGGTSFNFELAAANFQTYINSAVRYRDIVGNSGADVLLSNHPTFDGSHTKLPAMAGRKAGDPHPYVVGNESVQRYVKVAEECARANLLRLK